MKTIAEKFRYYANHPDYCESLGMCGLLEKQGEEELLKEVSKYMKELDSHSEVARLYEVIDSEGWEISCREIYEDWDNRPFLEDPYFFKEGDLVKWYGKEGVVIHVHQNKGLYPMDVRFTEGDTKTFTLTGRHMLTGPRELQLALTIDQLHQIIGGDTEAHIVKARGDGIITEAEYVRLIRTIYGETLLPQV